MISICASLPGRFGEWCVAALAAVAGAAGEPVLSQVHPALEEMCAYNAVPRSLGMIALTLIRHAPERLVIAVRQPDEALRAVLAETGVRFVLALEDPVEVAFHLLSGTGISPAMATRAIANCCPALLRYAELPGALTLHSYMASRDPAGAIVAIARHLNVPLDDFQAARIAEALAQAGLGMVQPSDNNSIAGLPERSGRILEGALAPYRDCFAARNMGPIIWARELFTLASDSGKYPDEPIDVSGSPRCLIYGPYIHIPAGSWNARIVLGFSREACGYSFLVDACFEQQQIASTSFQVETGGMRSFEINFSLGREAGNGLEIRVMTLSNAARGRLVFGHVILRSLSVSEPRTSGEADDFESVLAL